MYSRAICRFGDYTKACWDVFLGTASYINSSSWWMPGFYFFTFLYF